MKVFIIGPATPYRVRIFKINWENTNFENIEKPNWFFERKRKLKKISIHQTRFFLF